MNTSAVLPRLTAVTVAALLTAAGLASGPASAAPDTTYYSVPFSPDLYVVGEDADGEAEVLIATYEEWSADGNPAPVAAPTTYKAYEWSPHVFAEIELGEYGYAEQLSYEQWLAGGAKMPTRNTLIVGTVLLKWDTSPALVVFNPYDLSSPTDHNLSYGEWQRLGFPAPTYLSNQGYQKLSWSPVIAYMTDITAGIGVPLSYEDWSAGGFQVPQTVTRFPNDRFCSTPGSPDVRYTGPVHPDSIVLSYEQWRAAGSPQPTAC
jgi:hypothetical protein